VSHKLRTPMNAILGMTALMSRKLITGAAAEHFKTVTESANAMLSLVNDLLDFSRIEAGRFHLQPVPFALRDAIEEAASAIVESRSEGHVVLKCVEATPIQARRASE